MLIINPHSGRGLTSAALGTIISNLCDADYSVTVYYCREKTPEELAYERGHAYDLVACVGGDGTLNGVITGLLNSNTTTPIGYIPAGTANDVATSLSLSKSPSISTKKVINGTPKPLDVGRFYDKYFTYIAAFGAFTHVAYSTPQNTKRTLGHLAYVIEGIANVASIKPVHTIVEYDNKTIEGEFVFGAVTNSTSVAGLIKLNPNRVNLADGEFEVILVKQPIVPADFFDILTSVTAKTYDGDNVMMLHASNVRFIFDEDVAWTIDGEDGGMHKKVEITNCHKAIEIIM